MPTDTSERQEELQERMDVFLSELRHGNLPSRDVATKTVQILRRVISQSKWAHASDLISIIRREGKKLISAAPSESGTANMVRRVLKIVRDEYKVMRSAAVTAATEMTDKDAKPTTTEDEESLHRLVSGDVTSTDDYTMYNVNLKPALMDAISELLTELDTSHDNIASQALKHIHSSEIILTAGHSTVVARFLRNAARKRRFQVIVVETAGPGQHGHWMARTLTEARINTTLIPDSAVFALMSRVNKVIIGTHTVMADGGLKAVAGTHALALAAKRYSVPLIVCAPMFKLSPQYAVSEADQNTNVFNQFQSPESVLCYADHALLGAGPGVSDEGVLVPNPVYDYVPPELVTLFISNMGGNAPSYVYRLLTELYSNDDQVL